MTASEFERDYAKAAQRCEVSLNALLPTQMPSQRLSQAMRYAALGGGKRLRPVLLAKSAALHGATGDGVWRAAAALECVHVYSLIHDDLPCMDDDDVRRGRATTHIEFDEATAVLAGDSLLAAAFEILADAQTHSDGDVRLRVLAGLAKAAGGSGMIGGQMLDIAAETQNLDQVDVREMQMLKTGALIEYACTSGAIMAGASDGHIAAMAKYGDALGQAFQIRDDILDAEGDARIMGKAAGKDAGLGKATFVSKYGLKGAKQLAHDLGETARSTLQPYGEQAGFLHSLVDFVLKREK